MRERAQRTARRAQVDGTSQAARRQGCAEVSGTASFPGTWSAWGRPGAERARGAGRRKEKGEGERKRKEEKEKGKEKKKRKRREGGKRGKEGGGAGGIRGGGREPIVASTRSDAHEKLGKQEKKTVTDAGVGTANRRERNSKD